MSERVEFVVKATPNHFAAYDYHVAQKGLCRNSIEAKKLAASLNSREEELERLKSENAALAAEVERLKSENAALTALADTLEAGMEGTA